MNIKSFLSTITIVLILSFLFIGILNVRNANSETSREGIAIGREVTFSNCSLGK